MARIKWRDSKTTVADCGGRIKGIRETGIIEQMYYNPLCQKTHSIPWEHPGVILINKTTQSVLVRECHWLHEED